MKLTANYVTAYLAAIAPIAVAGCSGTLLGHCAVLAVTIGIFVGTLSLGRHTLPATAATTEPGTLPAAAGGGAGGTAVAVTSALPLDESA